ncbi:hypothetical protein SPRG_06550 [Saprolegnia parasitica CBS 223.65]|uniref:ABC transporter domain-containing protein n=1 Tax=Saprolegnia parasitica (strain CBS 223.65) TaxID=695850 RepID=A0A067CQC0_SAPPC|nr:hypothetical protein SPRG_06550 [Saprolegnia parasitica CBS 223.65]KDO28696.1 hypothetical protein SPRG_06550 [Saprolegnia parasitica CBS 223.65]|eukprot:XP_012200754.1 hypothetical protein SPRG_06550 [Saprolegnia parasitica CBS 223.65]
MASYALHIETPLASVQPVTLSWRNLELQVATKAEPKTILHTQSGVAKPGELLVIMGPSGAGKSSLLDVLAGRQPRYAGDIRVNGQPCTKDAMRQHMSYIMQTDAFYPSLTVLEHLLFQAQLRTHWPPEVRHARVLSVLEEMGLSKCRDTQIGDDHRIRGISGGERKRLSFASELLTNPSLLFVDEPTSGLDSFMAESVVAQLRALARAGRTVVATIHQPSAEVYAAFDTLYLLSNGSPVYVGPASLARDYFASVGHVCPTYVNPTDFFMRELMLAERAPINDLVAAWRGATYVSDDDDGGEPLSERTGVASPRLFAVLCRRNALRILRDKMAFRAKVAQNVFVSVIVGLIYWQLPLTQLGIQSFTGVLFFIVINQFFGMAAPEFAAVALELPIMAREFQSGLYPSYVWYLAKNASELGLQVLFPLVFLLPAYFMVGFPLSLPVWSSFYLFLSLLGSAATGLGYMVSCVVQRPEIAPVVGIMVLLPFLIFGGLFLNAAMTPVYFKWLEVVSPMKYAFRGLSRAFWSHVASIPCEGPSRNCIARDGATVLANMSLDGGSFWGDALLLVGINLLFRTLGGLFLAWRLRGRQ